MIRGLFPAPLSSEPLALPGGDEQDDGDEEHAADVYPVEDVGHGETEAEGGVEQAEREGDGAEEKFVRFEEGWVADLVQLVGAVVEEADEPLGEQGDYDEEAEDLVGGAEGAGLEAAVSGRCE
jgi:hypothetical protein